MLVKIILTVVAIVLAVPLGCGAVYVFNRIPGAWLVDYGEEPDEELLHPTSQRIKSTPWKYVFTALFIFVGGRLVNVDPWYTIPAVIAVWLMVEMAISDAKYRIVPDQFVLVLAITGLGFIPFHKYGYFDGLIGALIGIAIMGAMMLLGYVTSGKVGLGGGDAKLFAALGLALGREGVLVVFVLMTFLSAMHYGILLVQKRIKKTDSMPLVPYMTIATIVYLVIINGSTLRWTI